MRRARSCAPALLAAVLLAGAGSARAQGPTGAVRPGGALPAAVRRASVVGALDPAEPVRFALTLPVRDRAALVDFLAHLYTPGDPLYHHFLRAGEFAGRFGPVQADYDAVVAFANRAGLRVTATYSNRALVDVEAPAATVERALGVRMLRYQGPGGRVFHAPDAEPALPADLAARGARVSGLDDAGAPGSNVLRGAHAAAGGRPGPAGSGPQGGLSPADILQAYGLSGTRETGAGQRIALVELDGYTAGDVTAYEDQFGIAHVALVDSLIDGVTGTPTAPTVSNPYPAGPLEVTLDIELAIGLAPGASSILVYEGTSFLDLYNKVADDDLAQQVSTSWYPYGIDSDFSTATLDDENTAFEQMAAQGQTFFAASGDYGDSVKVGTRSDGSLIKEFGVQDPSSQPFVTGVGGTYLVTYESGGWEGEGAWSGSGGGISNVWNIPAYQSAVPTPGSSGSGSLRNVPDVALNSSTGYSVYAFGTWFGDVFGTSCAAPLWAAYTALVNQRRAGTGSGTLGFANPLLYALGHSSSYASDFHDITGGNNGAYAAAAGCDNVTGWGSFDGGNLIADLQGGGAAFWVDGSFAGTPQLGTPSNPFRTVTAAVNAAPALGRTLIYVKGGSYAENPAISKPIVMVNNGGGTVSIGH